MLILFVVGCTVTKYVDQKGLWVAATIPLSSVASQADCESKCFADEICYAYDWGGTANTCAFFAKSVSEYYSQGSFSGTNHYILSNECKT